MNNAAEATIPEIRNSAYDDTDGPNYEDIDAEIKRRAEGCKRAAQLGRAENLGPDHNVCGSVQMLSGWIANNGAHLIACIGAVAP